MNPELKEAGKATRLLRLALKHPVVTLALAASLFFVLLIFGPALVLGIREGFSTRVIEKTKIAADSETTAADQEIISAGKTEIERKAEDLNRETNIKPQRQSAAKSLAEARERRQITENLYEKTRNDRRLPDLDDLALRRRNCSNLAQLYPGHRFAGCQ